MAPGSGKRQGASKKAKLDASPVCLVPVEENDLALACTQAEEKPTIALKLADAQRELANAKLNATTAANEAKKQMTDQKKKNKDLTQMIRKLKRKVADGAVAAGKLERAHTRATAQQQKKVESLTGLNMQLGNNHATVAEERVADVDDREAHAHAPFQASRSTIHRTSSPVRVREPGPSPPFDALRGPNGTRRRSM